MTELTRITTAVPEPTATAVGEVVVPLRLVVGTRACLGREGTSFTGKDIGAPVQQRTRCRCFSVRTASLVRKYYGVNQESILPNCVSSETNNFTVFC